MIRTNDIINSFTKKIKDAIEDTEFDTDVYKSRTEINAFDNDTSACFYIERHSIDSTVATYESNNDMSIIDIYYYPKDQFIDLDKLYEVSDLLKVAFGRNIQVKNEFIDIANFEEDIIEDDVGKRLHIAIEIDYFNSIYKDKEEYELMLEFDISND